MGERESHLSDAHLTSIIRRRRRDLLPWWIKVFIWIFMIMGAFAMIAPLSGIFIDSYNISLYGLETSLPLSALGIFLILLITFKGLAAYGLWFGKDWALTVAQVDAIVGIVVCIVVTIVNPFEASESGFKLRFRLEVLFLAPYFLRVYKIKEPWKMQELQPEEPVQSESDSTTDTPEID